jgi:hypothetical protein
LIRKNHRQGQYQMYPKPHFSWRFEKVPFLMLTPTTSHWPSDPNNRSNFPRSCNKPVTWKKKMSSPPQSPRHNGTYLHPFRFTIPSNRFCGLQ